MISRISYLAVAATVFCSLSLCAQARHPRHSRYPLSPFNDPQLQIPTDQAQSCLVPEGGEGGYQQFQEFDDYPHPGSKGYLCIAIPQGRTFVIDYISAEADYDDALPAGAEWYLDSVVGGYESMIGFAASRVGSSTPSPHYVLSEPLHLAVDGGTRVTLILHSYYVNTTSSIGETPGTASLTLAGHWE
jgi:hypothetical protein